MNKILRRLLYRYTYDLKLKQKLLISHTLLILLPAAVLSGFLVVHFYGIIIDDTIRSEQALSFQTASSIENWISHITYVADALSSSASVQRIFHIPEEEAAVINLKEKRPESLISLSTSLTDHASITGIRIYYDDSVFPDLTSVNVPGNQLLSPVSRVSSSYWYGVVSDSQEIRFLFPELYLSPGEKKRFGPLACMTRISYRSSGQPFNDTDRASAWLVIYFSSEELEAMLKNSTSVKDEVAYLLDEKGTLITSSDMELTRLLYLPQEPVSSAVFKEEEFSLQPYSHGNVYTAFFPIAGTSWRMIAQIPAAHIADAGNRLMFQFLAAYLFITAFTFFLALKLSNSIADRIITVAYQMETIRTGRPLPMEAGETGCDEIGVLADTYNYMAQEIGRLMDEQEQSSKDLRMAEFKALQAQVNPHFLYNTLDMINWLSRRGKTAEVSKAIQSLSRFYKLTLSKKGLTNTIQEELEHVELYVELQNMRYDNCVKFVVDVPEELYDYTIPKLTFQPIVENAFLHGIMVTEQKEGSILITGWPEEEDIVFLISDDGEGMLPEKLHSLLEESDLQENRSSNSHIGVYNTNLRLKSLYGSSYGLSYDSRPGEGTHVTIRIPARCQT